MITIKEYLDAKGKTIEKPEDLTANTKFNVPDAPEKAGVQGKDYAKTKDKEKLMMPPAQSGKPNPYIAKGMKVKDTQPLGELNPDKFDTEIELGDSVQNGAWAPDDDDTPLEITKMLKNTKNLKENAPPVLSESGKPYHPDPIQAIKYVAFLAKENDFYYNTLVNELESK